MQKTSLLLFTRADIGGRYVFRALGAELCVSAGEGRLWIDVSGQNRVDVSWQQCLLNLSNLGRAHYDLPWDRTDLHVSFRGAGLSLAGASASLPLFVGWIALLRSTLGGRALPDPFFAAGVAATGSDALAPAPREYVQGKIEIADALARKRGGAARPAMWVPEGSDFDAGSLQAIDVRQTPSLRDAVLRILGAEARP